MTTSLGHVAIIGGCGFLGANLVELLLKQYPDTDIAALDSRTASNRIDSPRISYHAVDITDLLAVEELFLKLRFDVVIHTAAMVPTKNTPDAVIHRVNVVGTQNLLTAARNTDVKAFVYTSSSSVVVGDVWTVVNADERWPVLLGRDQPEYYSETKVRFPLVSGGKRTLTGSGAGRDCDAGGQQVGAQLFDVCAAAGGHRRGEGHDEHAEDARCQGTEHAVPDRVQRQPV